jgi:hypothetical protein
MGVTKGSFKYQLLKMATHGRVYLLFIIEFFLGCLTRCFIVSRCFLLSGPRQFVTAEQLKTFDSSLTRSPPENCNKQSRTTWVLEQA